MKRSEINKALKELETMCAQYRFALPPFCHFTPEEWQSKGHEYDEVRECMLGWDITDYGKGDFDHFGFSLITIRNGNRALADKYSKVYAEKLLYLKEGQYAPNHFHWYKTEDIINRGGGNVLIRVYNSLPDEEIDYHSNVTVHTDGRHLHGSGGNPNPAHPRREHPHSAAAVPRLHRGGGRRPGAAGRGQPVQRRQHGQPLQSSRGPFPGN